MAKSDVRWAETAEAGSYLAEYEDVGSDDASDPGSRCGRSDSELDEVKRVLRGRGLRLVADDRGLVAEVAS